MKALFVSPAGAAYGSERSMLALLRARQFRAEVVCPGGGGLERELQELVKNGVLEVNIAGNTRVYRYIKSDEIRDLVRTFVIACDDRDFRVRAINLVIEGLQ